MANPVQTKVGSWNGGALTVVTSFTSLPASGAAVFVWTRIYTGGSAGNVTAIVDNQIGNVYTKIKSIADTAGNGQLELWWCSSITAPSGTFTVTTTLNSSWQARCDLVEGTSGLTADQNGTNTGSGTSGSVTASGSNTSSTDFVMAGIEVSYDAGSSISGPSSGYTGFVNDTGFVNFVDTNIAYKTEGSTVTSSATSWTWTNSQFYGAIIATFTTGGGGGGGAVQQFLMLLGVGC